MPDQPEAAPDVRMKNLCTRLAQRFGFDFAPGTALWVSGGEDLGPLIIAAKPRGHGFVVARTVKLKRRQEEREVVGFRIYYTPDWVPVGSATDREDLVRFPMEASQRMCRLIERQYLDSQKGWVRHDEYT